MYCGVDATAEEDMSKELKLKPCPFCNKFPEIVNRVPVIWVACRTKHCAVEGVHVVGIYWNRRMS